MRIKKVLRLFVLGASCLLPCRAWSQVPGHDRIIGAVSSGGGAHLVKHFSVPRGAVVTGVEFASNDTRAAFPRVAVLRGPVTKLSAATVLVEARDVRPMVGHEVRVSFRPLTFDGPEDIYIAVALPTTEGVRGFGDGAGILAKQLDGPGDSYFVMAEDGYLGRMDVEYAITLSFQGASKQTAEREEPALGVPRVAEVRAFPNPFNPSVRISLSVPGKAQVDVTIYDIAGRRVRELFRGELAPAVHDLEWDGMDDGGIRLASGIYLARARIADVVITRKLVLAQ